MYTYKRAVGISQLDPKGEELVDISAIPAKDLFTQFSSLIIVVTDGLISQDVAIDLATYRGELATYTGTIQAWLNTKATVVLKTSNTLPGSEYRFVTSHDIQYEWFSLLPGDASLGDDRQDKLDVHSAPDIRVRKTDNTDVDYQALVDNALWTYNGHLCRAVKGDNCIHLLNAGKHFHVADHGHVNCLNFNTVSKLKTYGIATADVRFEDKGTYQFLHYKAPVSLVGKTVWMSIGGRLFFDDVVQVKGEKGITIRTDRVNWPIRIFDSKEVIDLSSVIDKERQVVPSDFFTTESFFKSLFTDPSSFLIVLDNPNLYVDVKPITTYHHPYTYHTAEERKIPLMTGGGLLPKFFTRRIINRRLLDIDLGVRTRYVNNPAGPLNEGNLYHTFTNRFHPSDYHQGFQLYIRGVF